MFIMSNLIIAVAKMIDIILTIAYWLILVRALISWVNPDPYNAIVQFLYKTTEPMLSPIRRLIPPMGIDISPIIVFFVILFMKSFLVITLYDIGMRMR